ncbi:MAG: hypothetical protein ACKVP0_03445 [Pirellulaceae bacterium]
MASLFSKSDVERWVAQNEKKMTLLQRRLGSSRTSSTDKQGLSLLSLTLEDQGYIHVAAGNRDKAIACFHQAVEICATVLSLEMQGVPSPLGYLSAAYFQQLLIALAVGDNDLIKRFAEMLPTDNAYDPDDSVYIAKALKALTLGRINEARPHLALPAPDTDAQFIGYVECLRAIANGSWADFVNELRRAAAGWEKFTRREFEGQSCSSCFIGGVGLLKLARRVSGQELPVTIEHIPSLLL